MSRGSPPPHCSATQLCLTLAWHPQEAAAIIAQRPDNPREFFKQQERVASASSGSCDAPSPFNHRPGSLRAPCPLPTAPLFPTRPHFSGLGSATSWKSPASGTLPPQGQSECFPPVTCRGQHGAVPCEADQQGALESARGVET